MVKLLGAFKDSVNEAVERYEPFVVIRHVMEIAKAYNKFYNTHPILIKTGLGLVGIETPENM